MSDVEPTPEQLEALKHAQEALASVIKALNLKPDYYSLADAVQSLQWVVQDLRIDCKYPSEAGPFDMPSLSTAAAVEVEKACVRLTGFKAGSAKKFLRGY